MHKKSDFVAQYSAKESLIRQAEQRDVVGFIDSALQMSQDQLPAIDPVATRLVLTLFRVSETLQYDLEASVQRPAGLSSPGFHLLWTVWLAGPIEASVAATMMGVSRATVSGLSATLVKGGLMRRTPSTLDGRAVMLDLTAGGRQRFEEIFIATNDRYVSWSNCLNDQELNTLVALLGKLSSSKQISRHRS